MEGILNNINDCPLKSCKGKLLKTDKELKCTYDWDIIIQCEVILNHMIGLFH